MSKRPINESKPSGPSEVSQISSKRARTDDSSLNPGSGSRPVTPGSAPPSATRTRDPQYYYKDGSVILLVKDTLFKVHASLLEAQSEKFKNMFASLSLDRNAKPEGLTDNRPIEIPGVSVPEFRNLLAVFYSLPSDKLFLGTQGIQEPAGAWRSFSILTDVVRLSQGFRMAEIEKWAANQLRCLMKTSSTHVAAGAKESLKDKVPYNCFLALCYAIAISDIPLVHNIRNLIQCYCTLPTCLPAHSIVALLHHPQLRQQDLSLFGFIFLTSLNFGYTVWEQEYFTKEDRIALFSTQCYLTPLPESLSNDLVLPLLAKPIYSKIGTLEVFGDENCVENCRRRLSLAWQTTFDSSYYQDIASSEVLKPTGQLGRLPGLRLEFANAMSSYSDCASGCCTKALLSLDTDIAILFERLAGYYRGIN
ncbi:hypothetical protein FRC09_003521 [Ceratobasidium sp. 395]|nr:hypothetical protein FRC09_003521 [Ceratobasidium sp. 395]